MFQSFRILLVEDDDSLRTCLGEFLADHGWEVGAAACGNEAAMLFAQQRFDFSILDYHLPGITGLELFRQLSAQRQLPALLMSGLASTEEIVAARDAGFFGFLRKPLELDALRGAVEHLIRANFGGPLAHLPPAPPARPGTAPWRHGHPGPGWPDQPQSRPRPRPF
jgi:DNA-binding response OmpR family regulator